MSTTTLDAALVICPSVKARLRVLGLIVLLIAGFVLGVVAGIFNVAAAIACGALYVAALTLAIVALIQTRGGKWDLRLDAAGVTARGHGLIPWSDITEVRVTGLQTGRLRRLSRQKVAAFIARPGVAMPSMPSTESPAFMDRWGRGRRLKLWGSELVVLPSMSNVGPVEVEAAVRLFSDVPVRHGVPHRTETSNA
jgi:hypothetical protein